MKVKIKETEKIKILNSADVYEIMQRILLRENKIERNKERFWIIGLANNNKILYIELISVGTVNTTLVEPMEVFSIALQKRSVKIIMIHNHPSGEVQPSEADNDITDRLIQIGAFLNVPVFNHLIITENTYYSYLDTGLLEKLSHSKKYRLPYKEQEKLINDKLAEGEERKAIKIARELKRQGLPVEAIQKATGLDEATLKKIRTNVPVKRKPKLSS